MRHEVAASLIAPTGPRGRSATGPLGQWRALAGCLIVATFVGCAPTSSPGQGPTTAGGGPAPANQGPKRIVIAQAGDPPGLSRHINPAGTATPGLPELIDIVSPGLSSVDTDGARFPVLAAELPSIDKGSWTVSSDGRMQTTWKLRASATWHDGKPYTAADLVLAVAIGRDPELAEFGNVGFSAVDRV